MLQLTIMFTKYLAWVKEVTFLLGVGILNYFIPIEAFIRTALTLVIIDLFSRLLAVWKNEGRAAIISSKMKNSAIKFLLYTLGILAASEINLLGQQGQLEVGTYLPFLITSIVALTEFQSIIENIEYGTGTKISEFIKEALPIFKKFFKK